MRSKATIWIILIFLYYTFLFSLFHGLSEFSDTYGLNSSIISTGGGIDIGGEIFTSCSDPRFFDIDDLNIAERIMNSGQEYNPRYSILFKYGYIYDQETCESLGGTWDTTWTSIFFWTETSYSCRGNIDDVLYNGGVPYTNTTLIGSWTEPICGLSNLSDSQTLCEAFGCSWYEEEEEFIEFIETENRGFFSGIVNTYQSFMSVFDIIIEAFTFRLNFGFEKNFYNILLTLLVLYVPLILLGMSFYIMIR